MTTTTRVPAAMTAAPPQGSPRPAYHEISWFDPRRDRAVNIRVTTLADARLAAKYRAKRIHGGVEIWAVFCDPVTHRPVSSAYVETVGS